MRIAVVNKRATTMPAACQNRPTSSGFLAQIPAGLRIEISATNQVLPADVNPAQLGSLGGGNAVRLAPPVDLQLLARDIATGSGVALPDAAQ
jgi:hypothetical protein